MAEAAAARTPRGRRRLRNYLLNKRFQLKYAGYMFGIAAVLSMLLGYLLWTTGQTLVQQSREAVSQGEKVVALGQDVASESRKVTEVVKMSIVEVYADQPELLEVFKDDVDEQGAALEKQQSALEAQAKMLQEQSSAIEHRQRTMILTLLILLTLLAIGVGVVGIVVTHKVAGPIFKMTRQIEQLGDGNWGIPSPLRKGDELRDFYDTYRDAVAKLRDRQQEHIDALDGAMGKLQEGANGIEALEDLRDDLARVLERKTRV